jgi:hypothetical protein
MNTIADILDRHDVLPCSSLRLQYKAGQARISLPNGRSQTVAICRDGQWYRMSSAVLGAVETARVIGDDHSFWWTWQRNAHTDLVNFTLDKQGRLVGRVDQLAATMQEDELLFAISRLAIECDRLEYLLVGRDRF